MTELKGMYTLDMLIAEFCMFFDGDAFEIFIDIVYLFLSKLFFHNDRAPLFLYFLYIPIFFHSYIFLYYFKFLYFPIFLKNLSILRNLYRENLPFDLMRILFHFTNFVSTTKISLC